MRYDAGEPSRFAKEGKAGRFGYADALPRDRQNNGGAVGQGSPPTAVIRGSYGSAPLTECKAGRSQKT